VEEAFEEAIRASGAGSIRATIRGRSASAVSYVTRRQVFMRSYSATSAVTYLLGLGDRHLENFLVSEDTMEVFPIDFGAAFGFARRLPIPELIPVRCSPCIRAVTGPVDGKWLAIIHLQHLFDAVLTNDGRGELSSLLEVFVAEPLAEWQNAVMAAQYGDEVSSGEADNV